jgi:uncharacterized protein YfdQ (DUF2303 family)
MTIEEDVVNAISTLFKQAQKGVLAPQFTALDAGDGTTVPVAVIPSIEGLRQEAKLQSVKKFVDEYRKRPERIEGTAECDDLQSLIDHVNRFRNPDSALFARKGDITDPGVSPVIRAVYDYHKPDSPNWCKHGSVYHFHMSDEWNAWGNKNKQVMSQAKFAEFVEDHLLDVVGPEQAGPTATVFAESLGVTFATNARLLELSRGLSIRCEQNVTEVRDLGSGQVQIAFTEEHKDGAGQPLRIPGAFIIGIPVFLHGEKYQIPVRLRYRKDGARLVWFYELYRADAIFDFAFRDSCNTARDKTALPLLFGSPE